MTRGILIAGNESALTRAIEVEASRQAEQYAFALIPDRLSAENIGEKDSLQPRQGSALLSSTPAGGTPTGTAEKARIPLDWNPGSPIAARTLVIAAENRLGHVNEAILVCDPPSVRCAAADINMASVEMLVNDHIKGWLFLVKELATVFKARGEGTLALVYPETAGTGSKDDAADLLGSTALAAFRSLTRSLLASAFNDPYLTLGFSGADAGDEAGFAAFIFKQLDEANRKNNGKLYKYGKLGFFR